MALAISPPLQQFFDLDGKPLDDGRLYFGVANQNPETAPVVVYWDAAATQPAAQPIRTLNGYPARAGSPAALYASGNYSLTVKTRRGQLVLSMPTAIEFDNTLILQTDLASTASGKGANLVGFKQPGAGAVARTVQSKLEEIRSEGDFPSWGSRCFGVGTNILGYDPSFTGVENIAFGDNILTVNTTGFANIGVGLDVLSANTTGGYNYGFGIKCLLRNTGGMSNSAFGTFTLYNNTTGSSNVAMGEDGQRYADTGSFNVTVGVQALYNNGTGSNNTAVGTYAARGFNNPGDTDPALGPSPTQLCAFGFNAVYGAAGTYNHGFGVETLYNVTGSFNTATGGLAGRAITSGANNVFVGYNAGNTSQTASASGAVAVGKDAYTTGDNATAIGIATVAAANGVAVGQSAAVTGNAGIAIGAGSSASGINAIAIGQNVSAPNANQTYIGNSSNTGNFFYGGLQPQIDNTQPVGGGSSRWSTIFAGTGTINTSDEREKEQFRQALAAERRVALAIKGQIRAFKFKDAVVSKGDGARWHFGVGAQSVAAAFQAEGLNPADYGLFCFDEWEAQPEVLDDNGNVFKPAVPSGNRYGVRYDELAMFILSAI